MTEKKTVYKTKKGAYRLDERKSLNPYGPFPKKEEKPKKTSKSK